MILAFGWRLEFRDTDLRTSLRQDETFDLFGLRRVGFDDRTRGLYHLARR